jgi:hypothetical protein
MREADNRATTESLVPTTLMGVAKSLSVHHVVAAQTNPGNKLQHPQLQLRARATRQPRQPRVRA